MNKRTNGDGHIMYQIDGKLTREEEALVRTVLNLDVLLDRVDGDWELLAEMIEIHEENLPRHAEDLQQAVDGGDGGELQRAAHALKGALGAFSADKAQAAAYRLEKMGRQNDLGDAREALAGLTTEMDQLTPVFEILRRVGTASAR